MLTFFRKIRKGLLGSGQARKYLLYAIGEIALVVIGILIALQINNWNEWRKDRKLEWEYLNRLKIELEQNLQYCETHIQFNSFQFENVDVILSVLAEDTMYADTEPLVVAIEHVGWHMLASPYHDDVWQELVNNQNTRLIINDTLRAQLISHYSVMKQVQNLESVSTEFNMGYRRLAGDILSPFLREKIAVNLKPWSYDGHLKDVPGQEELISQLQKLDGLNGYLSDIKMFRRILRNFLRMTALDIENALSLLTREMDGHRIK